MMLTSQESGNQSLIAKEHQAQQEQYIRSRFREYMQTMTLYAEDEKPIELKPYIENNQIKFNSI